MAELLTVQPSSETLAELEGYDAADLCAFDRVLVVKLVQRHIDALTARLQQAIVDVAGPAPSSPTDDDFAVLEVAAALRLSPVTGSERVDVARELVGRLAATLRAVEAGVITYWHALAVVEAVALLDDETAGRVERVALKDADGLTTARFRARLRRAVLAATPKSADERHERARADRRLVLDPQPDGMAWLSVFLTAPEAIAAYRALDERAHRGVGLHPALGAHLPVGADPVTGEYAGGDADPDGAVQGSARMDPIDSLRADAFLAVVLGPVDASGAVPPPVQVQVGMTVDLPTLLRLADNPAELDGYGPIPPELARRLAADGIWRRMATDPADGHLLDFGQKTYRPPKALADYVRARDVTCRHPGCSRGAMRCDLDHAQSWECDGGTCSPNMGALCRRHHRAKTFGGWQLDSEADGSATFTSPAGHEYRKPAVNHAPEHTAHLAQHRAQHAGEQPEQTGDPPAA